MRGRGIGFFSPIYPNQPLLQISVQSFFKPEKWPKTQSGVLREPNPQQVDILLNSQNKIRRLSPLMSGELNPELA